MKKIKLKKQLLLLMIIIVLFMLIFPRRINYKDGGSYGYISPVYHVTFWNGLGHTPEEHSTGITVILFNYFELYNTFRIENR